MTPEIKKGDWVKVNGPYKWANVLPWRVREISADMVSLCREDFPGIPKAYIAIFYNVDPDQIEAIPDEELEIEL